MRVSIIVPTFNEAPNVAEVVRRVAAALGYTNGLGDRNFELIFVDDSTDETPKVIAAAAGSSPFPVRLIHREQPIGGLSGAVLDGIAASDSKWCVVMDGDLQHPPELIPVMLRLASDSDADIAIASRYCPGGHNDGLNGLSRKAVSQLSGKLARGLFPARLRDCTDPMTGFFAIRRDALNLEILRPRGFKILLEILAKHPLRLVEVPFTFGERVAGSSKANVTQGARFIIQLVQLRFGRFARFAAIGALGTVANLLIMAALVALSVNYVVAATVAAIVTIVVNFFLHERVAFHDMREGALGRKTRFASVIGLNLTEAIVRLPVLAALVELLFFPSVVAQAITLGGAFVVRYLISARFIYRQHESPVTSRMSSLPVDSLVDIEDERAA